MFSWYFGYEGIEVRIPFPIPSRETLNTLDFGQHLKGVELFVVVSTDIDLRYNTIFKQKSKELRFTSCF